MEKILTMLFIKVLNMSVTAGYCILAVFLLRLLFRKMPRKYLYVLWLAVAFRLVCPVSVSTEFSLFNLEAFSGQARVTGEGTMEYLPAASGGTAILQKEQGSGFGAAGPSDYRAPGIPETGTDRAAGMSRMGAGADRPLYTDTYAGILDIGARIWLSGILLFLLYAAGSLRRVRRGVRMAVRAEGGGGALQVYECDELSSPFVMGILHPRIYLPCGLQVGQRELVLLHEQYHIRRKDHLVKLFSFGLLAVYWFHPLVWAAWRGMCRDMEMSCDEKVLEQLSEKKRKAYGMTLLSFAAGDRKAGRMSAAFGENDVKKRIRHVLDFQKPAVWAGAVAVILVAAALVMLGTNGRNPAAEDSAGEAMAVEERLYEAKNPYAGDPSANGRLIGAIAEALPECMAADAAFTTRLQTSEEPYELHFMLEDEMALREDPRDVCAPSIQMLALTDNLGVVKWYGAAGRGEDRELLASLDVQEAEELCGVEDLKAYSGSPEKIRELLELLEGLETEESAAEENTAQPFSGTEEPLFSNDSAEFMDWYRRIPYECYERAVPVEALSYEPGYEGSPVMTVLAQTEDRTVTLYGYCSRLQYRIRGMTIDYRETPDGGSSRTYLYGELVWPAATANVELYKADYDRDGREEIALAVLDGMGGYGRRERLMVFETGETGRLEASTCTSERYEEAIRELVSASVDEENWMVHVIENGSVSSVPLASVPFEETEQVLDIHLDSCIHFLVGEEIVLESTVGLTVENDPGIRYGQAGGTFRFSVRYEESVRPGGGHFTLEVLRETERREGQDGRVQTLQQ